MNLKLRIFLILLVIIGIYLVIKTISQKKLSMRYGMYWTIIFIIMLLLIMFPSIIENISKFCGFEEAPNMLFLISIFILFYIIFRLYITVSRVQEINKRLVQEISILKKENGKK